MPQSLCITSSPAHFARKLTLPTKLFSLVNAHWTVVAVLNYFLSPYVRSQVWHALSPSHLKTCFLNVDFSPCWYFKICFQNAIGFYLNGFGYALKLRCNFSQCISEIHCRTLFKRNCLADPTFSHAKYQAQYPMIQLAYPLLLFLVLWQSFSPLRHIVGMVSLSVRQTDYSIICNK